MNILSPDNQQRKFGVKDVYPDKILEFQIAGGQHKYIVTISHQNEVKHIKFGHKSYQQYYDKLKHYSSLDHNDDMRRTAYLQRSTKIRNKDGLFTVNDPTSSNYWAIRVLW